MFVYFCGLRCNVKRLFFRKVVWPLCNCRNVSCCCDPFFHPTFSHEKWYGSQISSHPCGQAMHTGIVKPASLARKFSCAFEMRVTWELSTHLLQLDPAASQLQVRVPVAVVAVQPLEDGATLGDLLRVNTGRVGGWTQVFKTWQWKTSSLAWT